MHQGAAQLGKTHIAPTGNHMVRQRNDSLALQLMADLRPAQHHTHIGAQRFELAYHLGGLHHVPDVHAKADDGDLVRARSQGGSEFCSVSPARCAGSSFTCAKLTAILTPGRIGKRTSKGFR